MKKDNWENRQSGMICGSCCFFVEKNTRIVQRVDRVIGRCRFNAPTMKGFPVVFSTDWCGQHKLDENKINVGADEIISNSKTKYATD